jgi:hypothetical protein
MLDNAMLKDIAKKMVTPTAGREGCGRLVRQYAKTAKH